MLVNINMLFLTDDHLILAAPLRDEEDEMLQLAIQQSLLEYQQNPEQRVTLQALTDSQQETEDDLQR